MQERSAPSDFPSLWLQNGTVIAKLPRQARFQRVEREKFRKGGKRQSVCLCCRPFCSIFTNTHLRIYALPYRILCSHGYGYGRRYRSVGHTECHPSPVLHMGALQCWAVVSASSSSSAYRRGVLIPIDSSSTQQNSQVMYPSVPRPATDMPGPGPGPEQTSTAVERCADGQVAAMAIGSQHEDATPWRAVPRPLHITKRLTSRRSGRVTTDPRRSSQEREMSGNCTDSPFGSLDRHRPLALPKIRGDRGGRAAFPVAVGCTQNENGDPGTVNAWIQQISGRVCAQSAYDSPGRIAAPLAHPVALEYQRSTSCTSGSRQSDRRPRYSPVLGKEGGNREGVSPALPAPPECAQEDGSLPWTPRTTLRRSLPDRSDDHARTSGMPAKTGAGNPAGCPSLPSLPAVVHTLVPQIVVTPESAAADDGVVTIWVAVQLSVQGSSTAAVEQVLYDPASDRRSCQGQ